MRTRGRHIRLKAVLRLAEQIGKDGRLAKAEADSLVTSVLSARDAAARLETEDLLAFATSAVRDAKNSAEVLARVRKETGVELRVLPGEGEARMTFLAVRRCTAGPPATCSCSTSAAARWKSEWASTKNRPRRCRCHSVPAG